MGKKAHRGMLFVRCNFKLVKDNNNFADDDECSNFRSKNYRLNFTLFTS